MAVDELDKRILSVLLEDGRASCREMARILGVSPATVAKRLKKLESSGLIKGYTALLNHEKLGYDITVITAITVSGGKLLEVEREIAKLPGVCAVYDVTGPVDVMVVAKFRSRQELSRFTKSLLAMPHVERTCTYVVLTTIKEDFRLL
ncbi:MAG TPA: Lrp/AsnC family transcriptional regulator [Candidatus Bathyarchaeota archaeon]|nr:MAG: AsnC family transcriptional regulator [Candidatus Bathyarchaeota archaeon]HDJ26135.1 Lrp/AsnC family transcriptional regulator [Candidatus Bathyarchaeota archaeon]